LSPGHRSDEEDEKFCCKNSIATPNTNRKVYDIDHFVPGFQLPVSDQNFAVSKGPG